MLPLTWFLISLALVCFIVMAILVILAMMKYLGSSSKPAVIKVQAEPKDNNWSMWTAEALAKGQVTAAEVTAQATTKAATDNLKAQEFAAQAALANQRAEETRLERVRLEKGDDVAAG